MVPNEGVEEGSRIKYGRAVEIKQLLLAYEEKGKAHCCVNRVLVCKIDGGG